MKNLNSELFRNAKKRNRYLLITGVIFLILSVSLFIFTYKYEHKPLPKTKDMATLVGDTSKINNVYASIEITNVPVLFATYQNYGIEEDSKYYLAMDRQNILYIVYMSSNEFNKLKNKTEQDFPIEIKGTTRIIPNDIKKLAIEEYNKVIGEKRLTEENFEDFVGTVLLDMELSPYNLDYLYIIATLLFGLFIPMITIYLVRALKTRKILKKYSMADLIKIDNEVKNLKNTSYDKMRLYLTSNYVVDSSNNIIIISYEDIVWAYKYEYRYSGVTVNKNIKVLTKDNKYYTICNTNLIKNDKEEVLNEVLKKIEKQNSKILIGLSPENEKKAKEKIKNQKSI